jgi:hypothetical protein
MADTEYEILRGTFPVRKGKQRIAKGPGDTIRLPEDQAAQFVKNGQLIAVADKPVKKSKAADPEARAEIKDLKAQVAQLTLDRDEALAANAEYADAHETAKLEIESLGKVIELVKADHAEAVEAAQQAVADEIAAQQDAAGGK